MIERLLLAGAVVLLLWGIGVFVRQWSRNQASRVTATSSLASSGNRMPQIVSFYGPKCGACDTQKQIIEQLRLVDSRTASVRFVDAVSESGLAMQFGVMMVPTTIVASATGSIVAITCGLIGSEDLAEQLRLAV
jgi:thioredoxin-like negative regulator of GroEL